MNATQTALVLDALVAQLRTALPTVQVTDGQPLSLDRAEVLTVGYSASRVAVEVVQERSDLGGRRRREELSIVCLASSLRGEVDMARVRSEAVAIVDAVRTALLTDPTLSGAVSTCELGFEMAVDQVLTETPSGGRGASATVEFTIRVVTR